MRNHPSLVLILTIAGCHELIGDTATAEARYRKAVETAPQDLNPNRELVRYLQRSGERNALEANALLQKLADGTSQDLARWARRHLALSLITHPDRYRPNLPASLSILGVMFSISASGRKETIEVNRR